MLSIHTTYGAAFLALVASAVLYGITLLQTYLYFRQYPHDSRFLRFLVIFLWVLDTLHLVLCTVAIYYYLISNFNNPAALGKSTWSMNLQTDCNGLIGLIVECFFAHRVFRLSGNFIITGVIVVLAFVHFGLGVVFTVYGFKLVDVEKFGRLIWVTSAGLGSAAAADILIAVALCYYLLKSRTGFTRTDSLISTLIVYSITTGLLTGIIATISVICFAIMPTNYIWLAFFWLIGKFYVNSFLAALNSRDTLREKAQLREGNNTVPAFSSIRHPTTGHVPVPLTPMSRTSDGEMGDKERAYGVESPMGLTVNVQTQTTTKTDYGYL